MATYPEKYHLTGAVISAVDLIKGLGIYAGLEVINVSGATGLFDTNYEGKAAAAVTALEKYDYVYVHVEASDEAGHEGDLDLKIKTIEYFDQRLVGNILAEIDLKQTAIALLPDHYTPVSLKTHSDEPVPVVVYRPDKTADGVTIYNEKSVEQGQLGIMDIADFSQVFLGKTG
jgi:2,3-bisphosphoglycerate-independent phosphoglycerate mutase